MVTETFAVDCASVLSQKRVTIEWLVCVTILVLTTFTNREKPKVVSLTIAKLTMR